MKLRKVDWLFVAFVIVGLLLIWLTVQGQIDLLFRGLNKVKAFPQGVLKPSLILNAPSKTPASNSSEHPTTDQVSGSSQKSD